MKTKKTNSTKGKLIGGKGMANPNPINWDEAWQKSKEIEKEAAAREINYLLGRMTELVNILVK